MRLSFRQLISLLGILSAGSGTTAYSLANNKSIVPELSFSSQRLNFNNPTGLNSFTKGIELSNPNLLKDVHVLNSEIQESKVWDIKTGNQIAFENYESQLDLTAHSSIKETYSEMGKESKAIELGKKSAAVIQEVQSKLSRSELQTLQQVAQKYKNYNSSIIPKRRKKRGVDNISTVHTREKPTLNDQERHILSKHYEEFVNLSELKSEFQKELENFSVDVTPEVLKNNDSSKLREGIDSLKMMRWDYPNLKLFGGQYGDRRRDTVDPQRVRAWLNIKCKDNHCGWTNWEQNPYNNFFKDESEWKQFISKITDPQQKILERLDNPKKIACSFLFFPGVENFVSYYGLLWFMRKAYIRRNGPELKKLVASDCGSKEQNLLFKEIRDAKTALQFKIGSALLERMNLLN